MAIKQRNKQRINEVWEVSQNWNLLENIDEKKTVDGKYIIGIVEGEFFVPDGKSENGRFYKKDLWENTLSDQTIKERLSSGTMFGTIGHDDRSISEEDLRRGEVSHYIDKLWIDERGKGMGRAVILGTEAGKNLLTYFKAGCKLKTSSRAAGGFLDETIDGLLVVDPNNYTLETFDFVINPGFIETNPILKEAIEREKKRLEKQQQNKRSNEMNEELIKMLKEDKQKLETSLNEVQKERAIFEQKINEKDQKIKESEEKIKRLEESLEKVKNRSNKLEHYLKNYKEIGSVREIQETIDASINTIQDLKERLSKKNYTSNSELREYREIGTPEEINEVLDKSYSMLEAYKELGSVSYLKKMISENREYTRIGKPTQIKKMLNSAKDCLEKYLEYGSIHEVKELYNRYKKVIKENVKERKNQKVVELSEKFNQPMEVVSKLVGRVPLNEVEEILSTMTGIPISEGTNKKYKTRLNETRKKRSSKRRSTSVNETRSAIYFKNLTRRAFQD